MAKIEREYAEALYLLACQNHAVDEYCASLKQMRELMEEHPLYLNLLSSPAITLGERKALIEEAFSSQFEEYIVSFLMLLCENGQISMLLECILEFEKLAMDLSGGCVATITSAVELSEDQKALLLKKLEALTSKNITPVYLCDPALIGGIKVEADGKIFDGTLKGRLSDVKDVMSR